MASSPYWVLNAFHLPLGFTQVRENAMIEGDIVSRLPPEAHMMLVERQLDVQRRR